QDFKFAFQVGTTVQNFLRQRLVIGWSTASGGCNIGAYKAKAIVAIDGSRLVREASFVQRREKKITRAIARKDATCTISTVCGRGEAEDEQLRAWIAKSRNGLAPVSPAQEGSALCSGDFFAVGDQSRTFAASDDLFVQSSKQVSRGRHFAG